ncbi:ATP-dependent DNA helicase RecG [Dehalococcoidia bacterium]|nr:ATP-dependent DNA helicase RecG [Dehalococcoidia bacterium]
MSTASQGDPPPANANRDLVEIFIGILKLEQVRGYDDKSVYGGLDRFLVARWATPWKFEYQKEQDSRYGKDMFSISYGGLSVAARAKWVTEALAALTYKNAIDDHVGKYTSQSGKKNKPNSISLDSPATVIRGVTQRVLTPLRRLGVSSVGDLVYFFPRRHNQIRKIADLLPEEEQTVVGTLWEARVVHLGQSMRGTEAVVGDDTGNIRVVWYNQPYLARYFKPGLRYVLSGRMSTYRGRRVLDSPHHEELDLLIGLEELVRPGRLFPVYPLTEKITQRTLRRIIREALVCAMDTVEEVLPTDLLRRNNFLGVHKAIWQAHYPDSRDSYEVARRRLAFEELFLPQLNTLSQREAMGFEGGVALDPPAGLTEAFLSSLPFELTNAQRHVLDEVLADIGDAAKPMNRLLQGDVGSGKTVIALAALLVAATSGYQAAIMAPTEILAEQHFLTVNRLLGGLICHTEGEYLLSVRIGSIEKPVTVGLLLGSMAVTEKRKMRRLLTEGSLDLIIGTHALIQDEMEIPRLALAVVDEQHRFGVLQRASLRRHDERAHLLVMSATPIPRTLALTLYGDLDISTIDELPFGRRAVRTKVITPSRRANVYDFLRKEIQAGRQAFVIYPLINESEVINARAAVKEWGVLTQEVFPDLRVGLLHGRMNVREKQAAMEEFRHGHLDILVSTPVVEVGIDVPNATVMLIEGADRFGLAQLHQFRGRVGRGQYTSYCILVAESPSDEAVERLLSMERINDGFQLAEVDLQLRGPGDYFGTRQSGLPDMKMARLSDVDLLVLAREEAQLLLKEDPAMLQEDHSSLSNALAKFRVHVAKED